MSERTWQIATGITTTAFIATAVWGLIGWTRALPDNTGPLEPSAEIASRPATPMDPSTHRAQAPSPAPVRPRVVAAAPDAHDAPPADDPTALSDKELDAAREIIQDERMAEREERMAEFADELRKAVDDFAKAEKLDEETSARVVAIFEAGMEHRRTMWEEVQAGERTRWEARESGREHRQQSEEELIGLIGESGMERLRETLPGPPGRGGRRGPR